MPDWKMAIAFGRAQRGSSSKAAKMARERFESDINHYSQPDASARAEAFHRGSEEGWMDDRASERLTRGFEDPNRRQEVRERFNDAAEEMRTDKALQEDFDREFDDAIARHSEGRPESGRGSDDDIRGEAIDMLKNGSDISDVLRLLRGE